MLVPAHKRTEPYAEVVRPQHDREYSLPERQLQKPDGEEPCTKPQTTAKGMVLNFYFFGHS